MDSDFYKNENDKTVDFMTFLMNLYLKKSLKTKESRQMDSDFYKNENDKTVDLMIESRAPEDISKAPDCVCQTIIKRMEQLNIEIADCKELLYKLEAEYTAHANFIMNGPFEHRNLSQSSDDKIKSPQPYG